MTAYELVCITNWMTDHKPCLTKDTHYTDCADPNCTGCQPRKAQVGMVCSSCYYRIEEALPVAAPWFDALRGVDRAIQRDPVRGGKPGGGVPIAPVPLATEELISYYKTFTGTADKWVSYRAGAEDAVRFARAMRSATLNHPTAEVAHRIKRTRCSNPECGQLALVWNPPQYLGGHVIVACKACGKEYDQTSFEKIASIEKPMKVA